MSDHAVMTGSNSNFAKTRSCSSFQTETPQTLFQQALSLHQQSRFDEAESLYRQILDAEPDHPDALHFLGVVLVQQGDARQAIEKFEKAIFLCDSSAVYFNNYAIALRELGLFERARSALLRAVELDRNYDDAYANLGSLALEFNDKDGAIEYYLHRALKSNPRHVRAIQSLIEFYKRNRSFLKEKQATQRLITLIPSTGLHLLRLGVVSGESGDMDDSKKYFRNAADIPGGQDVWRHKHLAYCPAVFRDEEQIEEYWNNLNDGLNEAIAENRLYNWKTLVYEGFTHSFNLPHLNRCCKETLEKFTALFASSFAHFERPAWKTGTKIRVGFLVTPGHEGGFLRLCSGLIEQLDPEKFEVCLIYSELSSQKFVDKLHRDDLIHICYNQDFDQAVRKIKETRCDVIYYWKVGADTWSFFLPMCRLAPVQCTSWGTHGTSGVPHINYYLSWDKAEIPEAQNDYSENLYLLKTRPHYEQVPTDIPAPATREELNLPEHGAIYFCPHRLSKYHPSFDAYFMEILRRDPDGHLLLLAGNLASHGAENLVQRLRVNLGEKLFQRVIILPQLNVTEYYKHISVATVILHSPVYSGEITAVDGFLYGVPGVTQTGDLLIQRYVTAYCEEFGIEELAAASKEDYINQALKLGTNPEYREEISHRILEKRESLFENTNTVKEWERFFTEVVSSKTSPSQSITYRVSDEQAVPISNIDINVSYGCNLRCQYCTHFCSWISGGVPLEELIETFQCWHRKISPERLIVVGGEPLLHPELEMVFLELRRHWPKARIDLLTNGLLLPKHPEILSLLKELNGYVYVSRHFQDEQYLREFEKALQCLRDSRIPFSIAPSDQDWRKYYALDETRKAVPYQSDPQLAWCNCSTKNGCPSLMQSKLYKCAHMAWAAMGSRKGVLSPQWKITEEYQALDANCTAREILSLLSTEAVEQCRICPEKYGYASLCEKGEGRFTSALPENMEQFSP